MVGSSGRRLVMVLLVGAKVLAGCGPNASDGTDGDAPALTESTVRDDAISGRVDLPYTIELGDDPLCADITIGDELIPFECISRSWEAQLIAGKSFGKDLIEIFLIPNEAVDVELSPPAAYDRVGPYLIVQTIASEPSPVLTYSVEVLRVTCALSEMFDNCSYQSA